MFTITRALAAVAAAGLLTAACGSTPMSMPSSSMSMPGMAMGDGLAAASGGYTFAPASSTVSGPFQFRILGPDGRAVIEFEPEQTKLMHFYLVRSDLTGFQHVHPTMAADGTWTAPLTTPAAGAYRVYTQFVVKGADEVLSRPVTVPGDATKTALPAPSATTSVDGFTLTVGGEVMAGMSHELTVDVSKDGRPVTDLQPYLDTDAHLTAFHATNLAFAHLHPQGKAGSRLTFEAMLPQAGDWRLFIQFQTDNVLHTAAVTISAG